MSQNLSYAKITVGTTATLVFSGTGRCLLSASSGVVYGTDNTVTNGGGNPGFSNALMAGLVLEFDAPVEVWAIGDDGADFVSVVRWY